jgi:hypothetical protein
MTAITHSFTFHVRPRQRASRSLWGGIGAGLAIALVGLTMTLVGTSGRLGGQSWQDVEHPATPSALENIIPTDFFSPE